LDLPNARRPTFGNYSPVVGRGSNFCSIVADLDVENLGAKGAPRVPQM
jgi:hypothetical protein